jgi:hypothetical protein
MIFEQRMALVKAWMKEEIMPRFSPPSGLDASKLAMDIAEAVNSAVPNVTNEQHFKYLLEQVQKNILKSARTRVMPTVKEFSAACSKLAIPDEAKVNEGWKLCPYTITEKQVRSDQPIAAYWLEEHRLAELLDNTNLTMEDMRKYTAHMQ